MQADAEEPLIVARLSLISDLDGPYNRENWTLDFAKSFQLCSKLWPVKDISLPFAPMNIEAD